MALVSLAAQFLAPAMLLFITEEKSNVQIWGDLNSKIF